MSLQLHPKEHAIPSMLRTDQFIFRPLLETDVELDYQAVIASREFLLKVSQGNWPKEGFTLEENRQDLIRHERLHQLGEEFTFTIMNPLESECLGCIYLQALQPRLASFLPDEDPILKGIKLYAMRAHFWLAPGARADNLELPVLKSLATWLTKNWRFSQVVFVITPYNTELFDPAFVADHFKLLCSETTDTGNIDFYTLAS